MHKAQKFEPGWPNGMFPKPFGFILCIHLVKIPGSKPKLGRLLDEPSVDHTKAHHPDFFFTASFAW